MNFKCIIGIYMYAYKRNKRKYIRIIMVLVDKEMGGGG